MIEHDIDPGPVPEAYGRPETDAAVDGYNRGRRVLLAISAPTQFAQPDVLYRRVLDCIEADGRVAAPSIRLRTMLREVQKSLEAAGRS